MNSPEQDAGQIEATMDFDTISDELAERFLDGIAAFGVAGDADGAASLFHPDVEIEDRGVDDLLHGRDAVRELFGGVFKVMPDFTIERVGPAMFSSDHSVLGTRWKITGTRPDGSTVSVDSFDLYRFRDGLVAHQTILVRDPNWLGAQLP